MPIKFYKVKDTHFRKVVIFDEVAGTKTAIALIGRYEELVDEGLLSPVDHITHEESRNKWILIPKQDFPENVHTVEAELMVFDTLLEAKRFILGDF